MAFPSKKQRFVIESDLRRIVVVAAPGTGKTKTIVERVIRLLKEDPERVISLVTFTRSSRRDTDGKLRDTVGEKAVDVEEEQFPRVSTLHAFAKALVHRYPPFFGRDSDFGILVPDRESMIVVADVVDDIGLPTSPALLKRAIVEYQCTGSWPPNLALDESQLQLALATFRSHLRFYNTFDMEGLVEAACLVFERAGSDIPPILLHVDEYQDLNLRDQALVRLAGASDVSQVMVVGDDAQSIYGFRHARPEGIRELWEETDWHNVGFDECHRLPSHVLRAANSLIKKRGYLGGEVALPDDDGRRLLTLQCTTSDVQVKAVAKQINELMGAVKKDDGTPLAHQDFMVLCPTNNLAGIAAKDLSDKYGIPVRERPGGIPDDGWRLLLLLRLLQEDGLALRQWLTLTGLPPQRIVEVRRGAMEARQTLFEYCRGLADAEVVNCLGSLTRLFQSLVDPAQFAQSVCEFPHLSGGPDLEATVGEIAEFAPSVRPMIRHVYEKYGVIDGEVTPDESGNDSVLVSTMHMAKGLEAEFVFLLWLNDTFLPANGRDPVEEERVLYVALTRARQDVILTFHERWDASTKRRLKEQAMSPFLKEISDHIEIKKVSAPDLK